MQVHGTPVRLGTWLFNDMIPSAVRICESEVAFGTGDYEDEPDVSEDRTTKCFYVDFCTAGSHDDWRSTGFGPFGTLEEAEAHVLELTKGTVVWQG